MCDISRALKSCLISLFYLKCLQLFISLCDIISYSKLQISSRCDYLNRHSRNRSSQQYTQKIKNVHCTTQSMQI
ncbi:hypothetical protein X975_26872, partial [Stegodyphus mimosarum]